MPRPLAQSPMPTVPLEAPYSHLQAALAHVSDAVITADFSGAITYMNAIAESLTGNVRQTAIGARLEDVLQIVDATTGGTIGDAVNAAKQPGMTMRPTNAVLLGKTDRAIIIEYCVATIRDDKGTNCGSVTAFRDVMSRRATELALQTTEETLLANAAALFEEKERAQVTLHSIGDAVISSDFRGRVSFLNIIAETLSGYTQAEASGRLLDETFFLVDSTTREHVRCPAAQAIIENKTVRIEAPCKLIRRDGIEVAVEISAAPIHDKNQGVIGAVMVARDVTAARDLNDRLARLALHDTLTGLPNRTLLTDRLNQALERAHRGAHVVALLFIDLDRFKAVNDSHGHAVGDKLLQAVAKRLQACVRSSDTLSRYGGDEFIIILSEIGRADDAATCAEKVIAAINSPFDIAGHQLQIGASIGIACSSLGAKDSAALIKHADIAMYNAKASGRNRHRSFTSGMHQR